VVTVDDFVKKIESIYPYLMPKVPKPIEDGAYLQTPAQMEGPVVGAIIFYLMQRYLADFGASYLILLGALGILVMLFAPKGLWGLVSERYDLTLFATRRRLVIRDRGN